MAVALPRRNVHTLEVAPRTSLADRRLGRLEYLHGWWYGARDCLGFAGVRMRLPGDVRGPSPLAREVLVNLDGGSGLLVRQLHPHLWATYLSAREAAEGQAIRIARCEDLLHEHFRIEALCAAPFGDESVVELALVPRWAPGEVLGAYLERGELAEFRRQVRLWRTP